MTDRVRIDSLAAGREHLARAEDPEGFVLVVTVDHTVPRWLRELAAMSAPATTTVVVEAKTPPGLDGDDAAGWEIGVCTAALAAGVDDIIGIDPQRVARVREITALLDAARPGPAVEDVP